MCRDWGDWRGWSAALGELVGGVGGAGGWEGGGGLGCWSEAWEVMGMLGGGDRGVGGTIGGAMGAGRGVRLGGGCHRVLWGCCRRDGGDGRCGHDPRVFWGLGPVGAETVLGVLQTGWGGGWRCCC